MKTYLKNSIIYQIYTRNFTEEGTFSAIKSKLDYLKDLGVDYIYLLPINPIGKLNRKGDLGSPYSIEDYTKINPELGNIQDFLSLIKEAHEKRMKVMIDIVFNHTSRDSWIKKNCPDWMYRDKDGNFANKVGDRSDVFDLDTTNSELIAYLVDVIDAFATMGVDGFRFDVASLISKEFFKALQERLNTKHPNVVLLAESVDPKFVAYVRSRGFNCLSDAELHELGFDLLYTYNSNEYITSYLKTGDVNELNKYKLALLLEDSLTQNTCLRIRQIENHDQKRLFEYTHDFTLMRNLEAYLAFLNGPFFIYNGLETKADHLENLFTKDKMSWEIDEDWFNFIKSLIKFKKDPINRDLLNSIPVFNKEKTLLIINSYKNDIKAYGIFPLSGLEETVVSTELEDGTYINYLTNEEIIIKDNSVTTKEPLMLFKK